MWFTKHIYNFKVQRYNQFRNTTMLLLSHCNRSLSIRIKLGCDNRPFTPVTVAARSKAWNVFTRLITGVVSSNPTRGMDVCMRLFCLCCPVQVAALRRADHSSKESYQPPISVRLRNLIRGGQGPTWARAPLKKKKKKKKKNRPFIASLE
jgi:hypothetical protein